MTLHKNEIAAIFRLWAHEYSENPDKYTEILDENGQPYEDYGDSAAAEFERLAKSLGFVK